MEQLSFRDPAGIVYNQNGKILRKIKIEKFVLDRFEILEKKILINSKRILYYLELK